MVQPYLNEDHKMTMKSEVFHHISYLSLFPPRHPVSVPGLGVAVPWPDHCSHLSSHSRVPTGTSQQTSSSDPKIIKNIFH